MKKEQLWFYISKKYVTLTLSKLLPLGKEKKNKLFFCFFSRLIVTLRLRL